jgi:hypothetical protein
MLCTTATQSFDRRTFLEIETSAGQRPVYFSYLRN